MTPSHFGDNRTCRSAANQARRFGSVSLRNTLVDIQWNPVITSPAALHRREVVPRRHLPYHHLHPHFSVIPRPRPRPRLLQRLVVFSGLAIFSGSALSKISLTSRFCLLSSEGMFRIFHICLSVIVTVVYSTQDETLKFLLPLGLFISPGAGKQCLGFAPSLLMEFVIITFTQ